MWAELAAMGVNAGLNAWGAQQQASAMRDANAANIALSQEQMDWSASQAYDAMRFDSQNAEITREYNAAEAAKARGFGHDEASRAMAFSADQAQREMDFQEQMSGSSYQRAVADMRKAGINPMLAITQGGASSPSGAMGSPAQGPAVSASGPSASGSMGSYTRANINPVPSVMDKLLSGAGDALRSIVDVKKGLAQVENVKADTDQKDFQNRLLTAQAKKAGVDTQNAEQSLFQSRRRLDFERAHPGIPWGLLDSMEARSGVMSSAKGLFDSFRRTWSRPGKLDVATPGVDSADGLPVGFK